MIVLADQPKPEFWGILRACTGNCSRHLIVDMMGLDGRPQRISWIQSYPFGVHYVYVLRCGDGSLYTGYTTDVNRRLEQHRAGDGAKYTRGRGPLTVVHTEAYETRSAAMSREHEIKQLSHDDKEQLID